MSLSLTSETEQLIAVQLAGGRYQSADEVILAGLALLDERERRLTELRRQVEIGAEQIMQGRTVDGELVLDRLLTRLHQQSAS